jgi:putative ABC transport system permease protein
VAVFGALALFLAGIGVYGVISFSVSQRTHEIGLRMALGAKSGDAMALVVRQGLTLALIGVVVGLVASIALTRVMGTFLVGVDALDPVVFGGVALVLSAVSMLASYIPALRATRVDPVTALRFE